MASQVSLLDNVYSCWHQFPEPCGSQSGWVARSLRITTGWRVETCYTTTCQFQSRSGCPFAFAGLWNSWQPSQGPPVESCTILTTSANAFMQPLHDRMPVILSPDKYPLWLDPELTEPEPLIALFDQYPDHEMTEAAVSSMVNSALSDSPDLIVPGG